MSLRELQDQCEAGLADLPIPHPFSIEQLRINMEEARGRTIVLHPIPEKLVTAETACGLRIKAPEFSVVLYRQRPTAYKTDHVKLHELTHEWFDHGTNLSPDRLQALMPVFDTDLIERVTAGEVTVQARANFDTDEEKIAELGASLIPRMAREMAGDDMLTRLGDTLSRPAGRRATRRRFHIPFRRS
jgi:hypothetical protein